MLERKILATSSFVIFSALLSTTTLAAPQPDVEQSPSANFEENYIINNPRYGNPRYGNPRYGNPNYGNPNYSWRRPWWRTPTPAPTGNRSMYSWRRPWWGWS